MGHLWECETHAAQIQDDGMLTGVNVAETGLPDLLVTNRPLLLALRVLLWGVTYETTVDQYMRISCMCSY
jgi:hypothetical protein